MKRKKLLVLLFAAFMAVNSFAGLCACTTTDNGEGKGNGGVTGDTGSTGGADKDGETGDTGDTGNTDTEPDKTFAKYTDISKWNFAVTYREVEEGFVGYEDYYEYCGKNILYKYDRYDDNEKYLGEATDYLGYDEAQSAYYLYYDNLSGGYTKYKQGSTEFYNYYYLYDLDLTVLGDYAFNGANGVYEAAKPDDVGNAVVGEFTGYTWIKFAVTVAEGNITQIDGTQNDGFVMRFTFNKHGEVDFDLPAVDGGDTPTEPTETMEKQTYDAATFDDTRLQQKLTTTGDQPDPATGLPSTGTYDALVIPVKFSDTSISATQLNNLNIAFNGTSAETGWESVKTYYNKASYGKLNLSFDIAGANLDGVSYYTSSKASSYYEGLKATDEESGEQYNNGDNVLLHEVLAYYESRLDLTKYDTNGDGAIDAVYLIYSAPVDYSDDSFYWAYVTWNYEETKYDGKDTFYYLFAGLDFMKESVQGGYTNEYYPVIEGLKVNASTYIHETGHLLGLDDYYDYYPDEGCNEGLGGADMMDATVGDQNVYSKTMLGWLNPEIVTATKTVTLSSSQAEGDAILIPLNFNNSYFCEYLLIDLYSAQGLNALHSSSLYDGADYGVRIYHVTATVSDPFNNDFGSFTDCNNSTSDKSLIKLIEADGDNKFASSDGYAAESDLWQAGDTLGNVFPKYVTNAGKLLIFDISIVSVSATQATITITYNA
mgnify:CR=1 FL=1